MNSDTLESKKAAKRERKMAHTKGDFRAGRLKRTDGKKKVAPPKRVK